VQPQQVPLLDPERRPLQARDVLHRARLAPPDPGRREQLCDLAVRPGFRAWRLGVPAGYRIELRCRASPDTRLCEHAVNRLVLLGDRHRATWRGQLHAAVIELLPQKLQLPLNHRDSLGEDTRICLWDRQ